MNVTLAVAHNIFLDRKQRYALAAGEKVDVIGVSVPTWYYEGKTSEPSTEIFCKYSLVPTKYKITIKNTSTGYEMQLPLEIYNEEENINNPISISSILDIKDGGCEWLAFRQASKIKKKGKKLIYVVQFVEIKTIEELNMTLA